MKTLSNKCKTFFPISRLYIPTVSLNHHITTIHEGKKPYQCNYCDSQFFNMNQLKKHRVSVHEKVSHNCDLCGKVFFQKGHLNRHTRNVHEVKKPGDNSVLEVTNESEIA